MKTFLAIIGAFALIFIVFFGALIFMGVQRVGPLINEAGAYADESLTAIATDWDGEEFWRRAAPELKEALDRAEADQLMSAASFQLGTLVKNNGAACEFTQYNYGSGGEFAVAQCSGTAEFQKAHAEYLLNIVKRDGEWKIFAFFLAPGEATNSAVTVAYERRPFRPDSIKFSWKDLAAGISSGDGLTAGADISSTAKIENVE